MRAFPRSFDMTGNMPGHYTIGINPSIKLVHHSQRKVQKELWYKLEDKLQEVVTQGIITLENRPTESVNSLTYSLKPDGTLHICLDPLDLNKVILWEYNKPPILN